MSNLFKNKPFNWACCILLSFSLVFSSVAPAAAFPTKEKAYQEGISADNEPPEDNNPIKQPAGKASVVDLREPAMPEEPEDLLYDRILASSGAPPTINMHSTEVQYSLDLLESNSYFSELHELDKLIFCAAFEVNSSALEELETLGINLADSIGYAQMEYVYGFPVEVTLGNYPTPETFEELYIEMRRYSYFADIQNEGFDSDGAFKQYILDNKSFQQVKTAFDISWQLGIDIGSLLAEENIPGKSTSTLTTSELKKYEAYAEEIKLNLQPLVEFAMQNDLTFDGLQELIAGQQQQSGSGQMAAIASVSPLAPFNLQPV